MKKLIINTTDNKRTTIKLQVEKEIDTIAEENIPRSQNALVLIDKLLKKNNMKLSDIEEVEVNSGPGSFTGTRVGVAIANALGFGLDVKVNGKKGKNVEPKYF